MAAAVLTAALLLPVFPHTAAELEAWYADWSAAPAQSAELLMALMDMKSRHPCLPEVCQPKEVMPTADYVGAVATPPSDNSGMGNNVEQWRNLVAAYFPTEHVDRMLRIAACESHGVPTAVNPSSGAAGIFQIMPQWQKTWPGDYFDPWTNASVAYQIWLVQGFGAWVCR